MPPRSPDRSIGAEVGLARRLQELREGAKMSPAGLAHRMTLEGCPMTQSAVWKIENGDPPRRITLDEAVALAKIFGRSVDELAQSQQTNLFGEISDIASEIVETIEVLRAQSERMHSLATDWAKVRGLPETESVVRNLIGHPASQLDEVVEIYHRATWRLPMEPMERPAPAREGAQGG